MKNQFVQVGQIKKLRDVSLAFTVPDDLPSILISGTTLVWTKQALKTFSDIHRAAYEENEKFKELPYQSLRGGLTVNLEAITRIESHLGLEHSLIRNVRSDKPQEYSFACLLDSNDNNQLKKRLRSTLNNWLVNYLRPFCKEKNVPDNLLDQVQNLIEHNELIRLSTFGFNLLPWAAGENGTTEPEDGRAYIVVVDYVARLIAGKELFEGCGPMRRVISSYGKFASNIAELITSPIFIENKGRFSLVVKLQVVTFASISQPIIKLDVSKRRWLDLLDAPERDRQKISGYAFSSTLQDRTFSFKVAPCKDNDEWTWKTEKDFGAIRRQLELGMQTFSGQDIVLGNADIGGSQLVLCHRNSLGKHGIDAGVPEVDKLEAYTKVEKIVSTLGLVPFAAYEPIGNKSSKRQEEKEIKLPTLLSALLQISDSDSPAPTLDYINKLSDSQLNQQLAKAFRFSSESVKFGRKAFQVSQPKESDFEELQAIRERNSNALKRLYPGEKLSLFIFYQDGFREELKFLTALAQLLWGESVEIVTNSLPPNTHGSRHDLPNPKAKAQERSNQRIKAWESTAKQLAEREGRIFCLVLAAKFFKDEDGTDKRDDPINKPSTRRALASLCGACVQFITQMNRTKNNLIDLVDYSRRGQQALKDLLSAHSGRVESIKDKVDECLQIPSASKPKEIIAITIVRKQKGRVRGRIESTFLPIAIRINVETERCDICCAYAIENKLKPPEWEHCPDALARIANISPVKIGNSPQTRKRNFMQFVRDVISSSVKQGMQPLVMIDSTNCVQLWPWLADSRIDANNIQLDGVSGWMHKEWAGGRLVRIKQGFTPAIIEEKVRYIMESSISDERSLAELKQLDADIKVPSASSTPGKLFRLNTPNSTGCIAYLSIGSKAVQQEWRGQSCYRTIPAYTPVRLQDSDETSGDDVSKKRPKKLKNAAGIEMRELSEKLPFIKQWPTPNPLEILVTLRQDDDDPDQVAALVESLRYVLGHYAESTTLPAPLFFERVVRDYISDFSIEEGSENEEL